MLEQIVEIVFFHYQTIYYMIHFVPLSLQKVFHFSWKEMKISSFAHTTKWLEKKEAYLFQITFPTPSSHFQLKIHQHQLILFDNFHHIKYDLPKHILINKIEIQQTSTHINVLIPKENNWRKLLLEDLKKIDDAYIIENDGTKLTLFQKIRQKVVSIVKKLRN